MIKTKIEEVTRRIWTDIDLAQIYNTIFSEETISDSILLELAKQQYFSLKIIQTPKPTEATQGTDWEWFVGSSSLGWIRYAIQAKKINLHSNSYLGLNHKVGKKPHQQSQSALLRKYATATGSIPLYCFYNHNKSAIKAHWNCPEPFEKELLGWTYTPLLNIEASLKKHGTKNFDKIHRLKETKPIRCLFTCQLQKAFYEDRGTISKPGNFCGEPFQKIAKLPDKFISAKEIKTLTEFPEELYPPSLELYPRRVVIIDLSQDL